MLFFNLFFVHCCFASVLHSLLRMCICTALFSVDTYSPLTITIICICLSLRLESMAPLLPLSPRTPVTSGVKDFEMPKTQWDQRQTQPTRTLPDIQPSLPSFTSSLPTSSTVTEVLHKPASHSIHLANQAPPLQPVHHKSLSHVKPHTQPPTSRSLQGTLLPSPLIDTTSKTELLGAG